MTSGNRLLFCTEKFICLPLSKHQIALLQISLSQIDRRIFSFLSFRQIPFSIVYLVLGKNNILFLIKSDRIDFRCAYGFSGKHCAYRDVEASCNGIVTQNDTKTTCFLCFFFLLI